MSNNKMENDDIKDNENCQLMWFWHDKDKSYKRFSNTISEQIDKLKIGEIYTFTHQFTTYEIKKLSDDKCLQRNTITNYQRKVIRQFVNESNNKQHQWYWKDNDRSYKLYSDNISQKLNEMNDDETYIMTHNITKYEIKKISNDRCEQRNIQTNYRRDAVRDDQLVYRWHWKQNDGSYQPYSFSISDEIEKLESGQSHFVSANFKYEIIKLTKNTCQQRNSETQAKRAGIRRLVLKTCDESKINNDNLQQEQKYARDESLTVPVLRIGVIGAGNVATQILTGMIKRDVLAKNSQIIISDLDTQKLGNLYNNLTNELEWNAKNISISTITDNKKCIKDCDIVFIAVRPEHFPSLMTQLYSCWTGKEIIVSIPTQTFEILETKLTNKSKQSIIRIIANQCSKIDPYSIILAKGKNATMKDAKLISTILRQMGVIKLVDENLIPLDNTKYGFIAKQPNERLECIVRVILMGVYDDNNIWSCLRGMRFIVKQIWELAIGFNKIYYKPFIKSTGQYENYCIEKAFGHDFFSFSMESSMQFPAPTNININMMPFVMNSTFKQSSLPKYLESYWPIIAFCIQNDTSQNGKIGYLTIHESMVDAGRSQRRPGLHTEAPGIIYSKEAANTSVKGAGNIEVMYPAWGGGGVHCGEQDGIYMGSSVDNSCAIWNCKIVQNNNEEVIGHLGDIEHLRTALADDCKLKMKANTLYWLTDRTPHEALPVTQRVYRQFFRLVTKNVNLWYKMHSTPNPNGVQPDNTITQIIYESKFVTAQKTNSNVDSNLSHQNFIEQQSLPSYDEL